MKPLCRKQDTARLLERLERRMDQFIYEDCDPLDKYRQAFPTTRISRTYRMIVRVIEWQYNVPFAR